HRLTIEDYRLRVLHYSQNVRGFFSQKGSGGGRGVKEKSGVILSAKAVKDTVVISPFAIEEPMDATVNTEDVNYMTLDATPCFAKKVVSPTVVDDTVEKEKLRHMVTTTESYPPLPTEETIFAGNAPGKSSYANVTGKPSGKLLNIRTLFSSGSGYARVMIELQMDVELKDNIVVAMHRIKGGYYTCNVRVEYEWKPPSLVKPQKEYRPVPKKPNASYSGNKKKGVEPTIKVSNSNPFDVLNLVDNDVELEFSSNTPIGEKIDKIERQICEGKLRLLDNDGNPLVSTGIMESDSEVEVVFDETANLKISTSGKDRSDKGYSTNNLLEQ
nr:hypothetical protein [Tanacetum cinerariifolium]